MKRKFMWLFLSGVMLLAAGGCGKDPQTVDAGESALLQETTQTSETSTQTDTAAETTETSKTASAAGSSSSTTHTAAETVSAEQSRTATTASAAASSATAATTTAKAGTTTEKAASSAAPQTSAQTAASTTPKATTTTTTPQSSSGYTLNDIRTNWRALREYVLDFRNTLMKIDGSILTMVNTSYGSTAGTDEVYFILAALNSGYINNDVIEFIFSDFSEDEIDHGRRFFYEFSNVQSATGNKIDFAKYTIDSDIGNYLNQVQEAYFSGTIDSFMTDQIVNGNIQDKYLNNVGIMAYMYSCDTAHKYLNADDIDNNYMNAFLNHISELVYGHSYTG